MMLLKWEQEWKHGEISKSPIANFEKILNRKSNSNDSSPIDLSAKLKANKEAAKNITKSMTKITEANSWNNESSDKQGSIGNHIIFKHLIFYPIVYMFVLMKSNVNYIIKVLLKIFQLFLVKFNYSVIKLKNIS